MKSRLLGCFALAMSVACAGSALAVEPYLEFVQGLREQGYHDYAILYLDQIAARDSTPAEIKQVIPYQKALTYQDSAKAMKSPEKQLEQLTLAQDFLQQFVKDNPNHPNVADANSDRATILLNKGQAEVQQAKSPSNQGNKREFQKRARDYISKAREVFQTAFDQHEANFKKYPAFIDQQKDPEQYAARAKVEQNLITASLSLGMCTYEEAQTYDAGSAEFKQLLNKAAEEFEKMHQKYRSQVGGLYARAWQGKCYEEQKDLQKAMGIYNELLDHPGDNPALSQLKTQTMYFKLICLNSKDRHDHQLVVDLADEWMKKHKNELRTRLGLSIQWEQALAYEALAATPEILPTDKDRFLKQARSAAQEIQRFPGEYKDVAMSMVQRLTVKLGGKEKEPDDFNSAFGVAQQHFATAQDIRKEVDSLIKKKGPADEIAKLTVDWNTELKEAARYFELALRLAKPNDDKKSILKARLFYSYVNYWQKKNYEAAILAQFVARTADKDDDSIGLDAAYIAMAAYVQAYNEIKLSPDQKQEDMRLIVKACTLIADRWPSSDKANEAYMILGRMLSAQKKPAEAAVWFGKVPDSDPSYPEAQVQAGQAYWTAYIASSRNVGPDKPTPEKLAEWLKSAETHLRNGIASMAKKYPATGTAPPELIGAKMSLSQIIISQGKDAEALKLLIDDPQSVQKAVTVNDETKDREEKGVTSRPFAMATYKLIFRGYIGTGNLEKARETMQKLEEIAGAGGVEGGGEVTELYVDLGKKLKDELERLRQNGETERYDKLMTSFETFLNDMASRKEGQTFGTLSWIGETYFALGETLSGDAAKAASFYEKAGTAFGEILNRAKDDQTFASSMQIYGVKLRQVYVLQLKKDFTTAETLVKDVIKESPNNLKVQTAAAELYQAWGSSGQADGVKKLIVAIQGNSKQGGQVWGWSQIAVKLQKSQEFPTNPIYVENFLNARYNGTLCRRKYAMEQTTKEKQKYLEGCKAELIATSAVTKDMPEEQFQKFNELYRDVLKDLGQPVADLPRAVDRPVEAAKIDEPVKPVVDAKGQETKPGETKAEPPKGPPAIDMTTWAIFIGCIVFGVAAIGWVFVAKPKAKQKSFGTAPQAGPVSFSGVTVGDAPPPATFAAPTPRPKPRPAATGAATGTKPATKPAASGGAPAPKPKPKPPSPPTK